MSPQFPQVLLTVPYGWFLLEQSQETTPSSLSCLSLIVWDSSICLPGQKMMAGKNQSKGCRVHEDQTLNEVVELPTWMSICFHCLEHILVIRPCLVASEVGTGSFLCPCTQQARKTNQRWSGEGWEGEWEGGWGGGESEQEKLMGEGRGLNPLNQRQYVLEDNKSCPYLMLRFTWPRVSWMST